MKARVILIAVCALMMAGVSAAQVPPNNLCADAEYVAGPWNFVGVDTTAATWDASDPNMATCVPPGDGVWYYYQPQVQGETYIDTCDSTYVAAIAVYRWDGVGAPDCFDNTYWQVAGCDADNSFFCGGAMGSAVTISVGPADVGDYYYVHVFNPGSVTTMTSSSRLTGGSLNLNLDGAVPAELVRVGVD